MNAPNRFYSKDAAENWMNEAYIQVYGVISILSKTVSKDGIECTSTTGHNTWEYETLSEDIKSVRFSEDS